MTELKLSKEKVSTVVNALIQLGKKSDKTDLLEDVDQVQIQICLKKIPGEEKKLKLKLPNPLNHDGIDVCLFVKDLDKNEREYDATVRHFQDLLRKHKVESVSEIIPLKSLKTEYKPYEAKRNLSNAYDIFIADARIVRLLPTYLGKKFYGMKKSPISVNMLSKNLASEIESVICNSRCIISNKGASSLTTVATFHMSPEQITDNVLASVIQIVEAVPGGSVNIKQLSLKTKLSTSIPVYMATGGPQDVTILRKTQKIVIPEAEEISTLFGSKVKVLPDGKIKIIKDGEADDQLSKKRKRFSKKKDVSKIKKLSSKKKLSGLSKKSNTNRVTRKGTTVTDTTEAKHGEMKKRKRSS